MINAQYLWNYGCVNLNIVIHVKLLQWLTLMYLFLSSLLSLWVFFFQVNIVGSYISLFQMM